jgi:hypothetical protein
MGHLLVWSRAKRASSGHRGCMSHQVIYRRGPCPNCQRETVNRVRQTDEADESLSPGLIDCTECKQVIDP